MELNSSLTNRENPKGSVLIAHGFGEHHRRYASLKRALNLAGYDVWFFDFTGHGDSAGRRAAVDVGALIGEHLIARKSLEDVARTENTFLFGHSMGGLITLASTLLSPGHIDAVAVTGPALRPLPNVPLGAAKLAAPIARLLPWLKSVELDDSLLSQDPAVAGAYRADPLVYQGKVPLLTGTTMVLQGNQVIQNAALLARPVFIMHGEEDGLADPAGSIEFTERAGDDVVLELVPGGYHELLNEPDHELYESSIVYWFDKWLKK